MNDLLKFIDTESTPPLKRGGDGKGWYYVQKETMPNKPFRSLGWTDLMKNVRDHRVAMTGKVILDVDAGWMDRLEDEICREGMMDRDCTPRNGPGIWRSQLDKEGRKLWTELHAYAKTYSEDPSEKEHKAAEKWLFDWECKIPNYSCSCRNKYEELKKETPPDFRSGAALYRWSVLMHDRINGLLGKPSMAAIFLH